MRNDPFSHDLSKGEGLEQKKTVFDVNIVFNEGRGKERTKMKHKHKTVLTDKGMSTYPWTIDFILQLIMIFY